MNSNDENAYESDIGLPQPFVNSMRTLFDILDDQSTGRIKFSDIEQRWHEDEGSTGLPAGVLDSLRTVTPHDGYLTFTSFCKGLQACLLRSKSSNPNLFTQNWSNVNQDNFSNTQPMSHSGAPNQSNYEQLGMASPQYSIASPVLINTQNYNPVYSTRDKLLSSYSTGNSKDGPSFQPMKKNLYSKKNSDKKWYEGINKLSDNLNYPESAGQYDNSNNINIVTSQRDAMRNKNSSSQTDCKRKTYSSLKMGTGGVMTIYDTNENLDSKNKGPPKPPRTTEHTAETEENGSNVRVNAIVNKMEALTTSDSHKHHKGFKIYDKFSAPKERPKSLYLSLGSQSTSRDLTMYPENMKSGHSKKIYPAAGSSLPLSVARDSRPRSQSRSKVTSTSSIESDKRAKQSQKSSSKIRPRRGGSLERLLDRVPNDNDPYLGSNNYRREFGNQLHASNGNQPHVSNDNIASLNGNQTGHRSRADHVKYGTISRGGYDAYLQSSSQSSMHPTVSNSTNIPVSTTNSSRAANRYNTSTTTSSTHPKDSSSGQDKSNKASYSNFMVQNQNTEMKPVSNGTSSQRNSRTTMNSYAWIRGDHPDTATADTRLQTTVADNNTQPNGGEGHHKAVSKKRGGAKDARRHTLQNGLDHSVVKRASQLEAERDMLHQGLQVVEDARLWYRKRLQQLTKDMYSFTASQYNKEEEQQKLHYQLARITEINGLLNSLMSAEIPTHLALAAPSNDLSAPAAAYNDDGNKSVMQMKRLRDQNHQLTEEVSQKSEVISALEMDKSRLLKELFQARSLNVGPSNGLADSTFM